MGFGGLRDLTVFFALFSVLVMGLSSCDSGGKPAASKGLRGGETRPALAPSNYTGITAEAYRAAVEIPEVIDSLYCYCDCEKHFGHKSLLTCFVDEHAVHCDICIHEAVMAHELHKEGMDVGGIRKSADGRFSHLKH